MDWDVSRVAFNILHQFSEILLLFYEHLNAYSALFLEKVVKFQINLAFGQKNWILVWKLWTAGRYFRLCLAKFCEILRGRNYNMCYSSSLARVCVSGSTYAATHVVKWFLNNSLVIHDIQKKCIINPYVCSTVINNPVNLR